MGPKSGSCGSFTFCDENTACSGTNSNSVQCSSCTAQVTALNSVLPTLQGIAAQFAQDDYTYMDFYYPSSTPSPGGNQQQQQQVPSWIQSFCTANNINPCANTNSSLPDPNGGMGNASNNVVNQVYWPYAIQPSFGSFINTASSYYRMA